VRGGREPPGLLSSCRFENDRSFRAEALVGSAGFGAGMNLDDQSDADITQRTDREEDGETMISEETAGSYPLRMVYEEGDDPDLHLINQVKSGDHTAFDLLMLRHKDRIFRTILNITRSREDAEDQVQETFLRAYQCLSSFRGHARFSSWLVRIALNQALQCIRRRRYQTMSLDEPSNDDKQAYEIQEWRPNPETLCIAAESIASIRRQVIRLPASLRSSIELHVYCDLSIQEIGVALALSTAAVKSRMFRARRRLRNN
jgi:RNA polymerase sigma-70 factor, ECF subfamily